MSSVETVFDQVAWTSSNLHNMQGSTNSVETITKEQLECFGAKFMTRFDDRLQYLLKHLLQQLDNPLLGNYA